MKRINPKDSQSYDDYLNFDAIDESGEGDYFEEEKPLWDERPQVSDESLFNNLGEYRSRQEYLNQLEASSNQEHHLQEEEQLSANDPSLLEVEEQGEPKLKRSKYSAKVDRFLTNGIIIVTVLLIAVLLIAFLV